MIVVARGGGSVEDLLPFSDEGLVRAVHAVTTPVVSAIGHEPDSPILDLVADVRASTPTDAAKRVVPDVAEEAQRVLQARERGRMAIRGLVDRELAQLTALRSRPSLADPRSGLTERMVEVDAFRERARRSFGHRLDRGVGRPRAPAGPDPGALPPGHAAPRLRRTLRCRRAGAVQRGHPRARPGHPHPGGRRPHRRHHDLRRPDRPGQRPRDSDDEISEDDQ